MHFSLSNMDEIFTFHSTGGKNTTFSDSLMGEPFFINQNKDVAASIPHVYAGGNITYTAPVTYSMGPVPYYLLIQITSGGGSFHSDYNDYPVTVGSLLVVAPETALQFKTEKTPFSYQLYFISGDCLALYFAKLISPDTKEAAPIFYFQELENHYLNNTMKQLDHLLATDSDNLCFYLAKFLTDIFTELISISSNEMNSLSSLPSHVYQMKAIFDREYEINHSLDNLEEVLNINKYRLCRDFSKHIGISPLQYLNQVRISHAKTLLCDTSVTIHEVGSMVGIPNTTHFIHLFQKDTGITPLQYRQTKNRFPF